jgi:hypothetical protein
MLRITVSIRFLIYNITWKGKWAYLLHSGKIFYIWLNQDYETVAYYLLQIWAIAATNSWIKDHFIFPLLLALVIGYIVLVKEGHVPLKRVKKQQKYTMFGNKVWTSPLNANFFKTGHASPTLLVICCADLLDVDDDGWSVLQRFLPGRKCISQM